ncbi:hypothetical protein ACTWPT_39360 [Nonomuraea sp. 3N208]|uniref:hypothetical protein n=1 Tax=Nonomuraea sp. 3N208 TaxID=3457421 RepID=UPI003FD5D492
MKTIQRISALALAATAVLTPAAARADIPHGPHGMHGTHGTYTQASAMVRADGSIMRSRNIVDVWRAYPGTYCVVVEPGVDLRGAALYARSVGRYWYPRSLSVERGARTCGGDWFHTLAVRSHAAHGYAADAAFYLTVS